jgi:hypothetical protein
VENDKTVLIRSDYLTNCEPKVSLKESNAFLMVSFAAPLLEFVKLVDTLEFGACCTDICANWLISKTAKVAFKNIIIPVLLLSILTHYLFAEGCFNLYILGVFI